MDNEIVYYSVYTDWKKRERDPKKPTEQLQITQIIRDWATLEPRSPDSKWSVVCMLPPLAYVRTFSLRLWYEQASEKTMAPHSSTLAWKIPWMEEPGRLQSMGSLRVRHDWATSLSLFTFHFHALEKEMAIHSSVLAWRIPGTGKPGGLPSMGSQSRTRLKRLSSSTSRLGNRLTTFQVLTPSFNQGKLLRPSKPDRKSVV